MNRIIKLIAICMLAIIITSCAATEESIESVQIPPDLPQATFAGGCFWCIEAAFEKYEGIFDATSGYAGGSVPNPTYKQVSSGGTGHIESVTLKFDPQKISYNDLLEIFWRQIDPTDGEGSFVDRGYQYTSAIFYHNDNQKEIALESLNKFQKFYAEPIKTQVLGIGEFYNAEEYHQDYHTKNPIKYKFYRSRSGRDQYRLEFWGDDKDYVVPGKFIKPTEEELRKLLTPLQFKITQEDGTEKPFANEFWDNKKEGIYVDLVSGEALFSSKDKYVSGTGWPSFTKPLEPENIVQKEDRKLIFARTEIRSKNADNHLGHVFNDGPAPTGLRYCMNSAALRFIPKDQMAELGYSEYLSLFD